MIEPWVDKHGLAEHLSCSPRSIQTAMAEGMPYAMIFRKVKFQISVAEQWLEEHGRLVRYDGGRVTLNTDIERAGDAATPRPRTRGDSPHASTEA